MKIVRFRPLLKFSVLVPREMVDGGMKRNGTKRSCRGRKNCGVLLSRLQLSNGLIGYWESEQIKSTAPSAMATC